MKRPIILEGRPFDWDEGAKHAANAVNDEGEVNWRSAFYADPGCMKCPKCEKFLWREGIKVKCPDCGEEFLT